jgi:Zn-dependent protease
VCHALTHAEELEGMAATAKALEASGDPARAREQWLRALPLLPPDSKQADWIRTHERELERASLATAAPEPENGWAKKLAPLGPVAIVLTKGKALLALFKFKFLFSLVAFMGVYWRLYGTQFGIGFALLILVHEMGHLIDIKRRGLPADMPVFLPGLGAYVRWQALGVSARTRAAVSLAGPLAGWIASAVCAVIWWKTGAGVWAALARASAWLNVLNLIPVWALDGGQAAHALSKAERFVLLMACLGLWLLLGESVFFLVAAGATYRLFTKDMPAQPSYATTAYFLVTLALLGLTMRLMPGQGFGMP